MSKGDDANVSIRLEICGKLLTPCKLVPANQIYRRLLPPRARPAHGWTQPRTTE
jgi:hypothetical protein